MNLVYHQRIYRLDYALNGILDSVNIDYSDYFQFPDVTRGNLVRRGGVMEFAGLAGHLADFSPQPFLDDSSVFIKLTIENNLDDYSIEKVGLVNRYLASTDFVYDEYNQRYVGTAYESFSSYRLISVESDLSQGNISESIYNPPNPDWNINLLTKVVIPPFSPEIYVRVFSVQNQVFDANLELQSVSFLPFPEPVYNIYMSQSIIQYEERLFCMSPEDAGYIVSVSKYTLPWQNGSRFTFPFTDSTATGSVFRGMDMNEDHDLLIGVHLKADGEEYANALKVIKCDTLGNMIWQRTMSEGMGIRYVMKKVLATSDGGAVIAAERFTDPSSADADGIILYRFDENGLLLYIDEPRSILSDVKIFPNPVKDNLYIRTASQHLSFRLMDMQGALVKEGAVVNGSVDMSNLKAGYYVIELIDGESQYRHKVLKLE